VSSVETPERVDGRTGASPDADAGASTAGSPSWAVKFAWAVGSVGDQFLTNGIGALTLPVYQISLGVSPVWLGWAMAIPRVLDAVTDPLSGNITDNTRTRWGRRRPYIFVGSFVCSAIFVLLWMPPLSHGPRGIFTYFMIMSVLSYLVYDILAVPRQALGYELCSDYHERTSLFALNGILANSAGFAIPWLYKLSFLPIFAGPERNEVVGVRWVAVLAGIVILVTCLPSALFTRERGEGLRQPRLGLVDAVKLTFSNRAFRTIAGVVVLILLAVTLVGPMNMYINIFYICGGDKETGAFWGGISGNVQAISGLLATPVIALISRRAGKKMTMFGGIAVAMVGYILSWWLFTPAYPWLQVFFMCLLQPGLMCVWVLNGSILADICDDDELRTGMRREGMYGAAFTFISKFASASITVLTGYILLAAGYRENEPITAQTLVNLRVLFIVVPLALLGLATWLALRFPITEQTARAVRAELDARHAREEAAAAG